MPTARVALSLPKAIGAITFVRFVINSAFRAQLPYLAVIAAAFGAPPEAASGYAAVQGLAGFVAPFAGVLAYRFGTRNLYVIGIGLFVACAALFGLAPSLTVAALFGFGLAVAKVLVDVQSLSFIGDAVPYERRGTVMSIGELPWAASWIVGVPAFGVLITRAAWWMPFAVAALAAVVGALAAARFVIPHMRASAAPGASSARGRIADVLRMPRARAAMAFGLLLAAAAQMPYLIYPGWLRGQFGLSLEALGFASIVIGVAEVLAELSAVFATDRLGKTRTITGACALFALGFVLFWAGSGSLFTMMAALFVAYFGFELALVASLPVTAEVLPAARSVMMGFGAASFAGGRVIGSLVALPLFGDGRLWLVALVCVGAAALAAVMARIAARHG